MEISTSINLLKDGSFAVPVQEQIERIYSAGFRHMDMDFWGWSQEKDGYKSPFLSDGWEAWVQGVREKADSLGVAFTQAHANVYNFYDHPDDEALYETYVRSLKGAAMLGIPWVTFHASSSAAVAAECGREKVYCDNIEFFKPLVELAGRLGTGVALENGITSIIRSADDLIALVDPLAEYGPTGVCWDIGHAHINAVPQGASLRRLGKRLRALHVQDNDGVRDQHMPPYFGTVNWDEIMTALRDIGYRGDFTFETMPITKRMPERAKDASMKLLYDIGCALTTDWKS